MIKDKTFDERTPIFIHIFVSPNASSLSAGELTTLHHGGILFLEALAQPSRALEVLVDAAKDAAFLAGHQGFGGEIVDTVVEAALYKTGVHLDSERCE